MGDHYGVIGVDFRVKTVNLDGVVLKLQMWFVVPYHRVPLRMYLRGTVGVMFVFDMTDSETLSRLFRRAPNWVREAKEYATDTTSYMLVGTKCDQRTRSQTATVDIEAALTEITMMLEADVTYIETSAKSGLNVDSVRSFWSKLSRTSQLHPYSTGIAV
jgi:Ras-related protein Rab-1A